MTKAIGKQPKVYQLAMENFESELDSLLDQLLSPSNKERKTFVSACLKKGSSLLNDAKFSA